MTNDPLTDPYLEGLIWLHNLGVLLDRARLLPRAPATTPGIPVGVDPEAYIAGRIKTLGVALCRDVRLDDQ